MTRSLADAIGAANRERVATMALDVTRAHLPDRVEGLRAEVVADFLAHPKIDVHVDPAMPNRPNVIARVRGTRGADAPGLLLNGHLDGGLRRDGLAPRSAQTRGARETRCTAGPSATCWAASRR